MAANVTASVTASATNPGVNPPRIESEQELAALLGPIRLAYFSPLNDQPILADRKASFILGAAGLIVTVLLFFLQPIANILRGPQHGVAWVLLALLAVLVGLLLVAVRCAYTGYVLPLPPMPPTLVFFRHVAAAPLEKYEADIRAMDYSHALDAILHYNYSVATQAAAKFRLMNLALRCMRVAIPMWMFVLLILAVWRR